MADGVYTFSRQISKIAEASPETNAEHHYEEKQEEEVQRQKGVSKFYVKTILLFRDPLRSESQVVPLCAASMAPSISWTFSSLTLHPEPPKLSSQ